MAEAAALAGVEAGTWTAMSAWHPLARLRWVQAHDPAAFARAVRVLQPKDYLALCLTGAVAGDRVSNAWAFDRDGGLADVRLGGGPGWTRRCCRGCWSRGSGWAPQPCCGGVPVFAGAMDTWCATVGAGAVRDGGAYIVSGTTDAAGVFSRAAVDVPGLVTLPWGEGLFHLGGPSQAGADCAAWAAGLLLGCRMCRGFGGVGRAGRGGGAAAVPAVSDGGADAALGTRRARRVPGAASRSWAGADGAARCWEGVAFR